MPETSIIIRTFNEEKHIGNILRAITEQGYSNYEIIIVDSGSTDATIKIAKEFPVRIIGIKSRDFTFGYALNVGCREARGKYIVSVSAHVIPASSDWLSNLVAPFENKNIAMVYGRQMGHQTSKFSEKRDFSRLFRKKSFNSHVPIYYANNANSAVRKNFWDKHPFDEYLFGLEDIDWAKRMTKEGYIVYYEPKAAIYHIHEEKWHQVFNRYRREAIAAVRIGLKHPPQARLGFIWFIMWLCSDMIASFPHWSFSRLEEILRFRYYQWKGSRQGWFRDRALDINRDKYEVFYPPSHHAVVVRSAGNARVEEMSLPEMKPGDILIEVKYVGVCRTDLEVYEGTLGYYKNGTASYPIVPGHEFAGAVVKVGANNKFRERFKAGDLVVGECILSRESGSGRREVGVVNYHGAYSQFVIIPGDQIHKIPDGLDLKKAVLTEPLAVVLRALKRIEHRIKAGAKIAVIGAGPIGNLTTQVLALRGYEVSGFDANEPRLKLLEGKVKKTTTTLDDLENYDVIVEATGSEKILRDVLEKSSPDSTILLLGFPYGDITYNFERLVAHEKNIIGSVGAGWHDFENALKLLPQIHTTHFTQTVLPLAEFEKAWKIHRSGDQLKILLKV